MAFRDGLRWESGRTEKPPALAVGSCHCSHLVSTKMRGSLSGYRIDHISLGPASLATTGSRLHRVIRLLYCLVRCLWHRELTLIRTVASCSAGDTAGPLARLVASDQKLASHLSTFRGNTVKSAGLPG